MSTPGERQEFWDGTAERPVDLPLYLPGGLGADVYDPVNYRHSNGPIPRKDGNFCDGPRTVGAGQAGQFASRYVFHKTPGGIRYLRFVPPLRRITGGTLTGLYDGDTTNYERIYGCFDIIGKPAVAVQKTATTIEVKAFASGTPTTYGPFNGLSPVLFENGVAAPDAADADLVLFYIDAVGDKLFARFQRDAFATEYEVNDGLEPLDALEAIDVKGRRWYLWARSKAGQTVVLRSEVYDAWASSKEDNVSLSIGFLSGSYLDAIAAGGAYSDNASLASGFLSGSYDLAIVSESGYQDSATLNAGFLSGSYVNAVIETSGYADNAQITIGFLSGTYNDVVEDGGTHTDNASLTAGFLSGSYDAA